MIVDTKDAVTVAHKDKVQDVEEIVKTLKDDERSEFKLHREVYRPWGKYDSIDKGERYQVKRITVNPAAKLSVSAAPSSCGALDCRIWNCRGH